MFLHVLRSHRIPHERDNHSTRQDRQQQPGPWRSKIVFRIFRSEAEIQDKSHKDCQRDEAKPKRNHREESTEECKGSGAQCEQCLGADPLHGGARARLPGHGGLILAEVLTYAKNGKLVDVSKGAKDGAPAAKNAKGWGTHFVSCHGDQKPEPPAWELRKKATILSS